MTRVLCVGDQHLGSGTDYGREPGERLAEQEAVWDRIVDVAIEQDVDALLHAGDVFERRRPTPSELLAFARPLRRLRDAGLDTIVVVGNHDVEAFDRPTGVELFSDLIDVHREPGRWNARGATVVTLPWTPVANLVARNGGGDRDEINSRAAELLLDTARDLRAQCPDEGPKILLLHWSVSGASLPTGLPTDTLREPVIPLDELEQLGFDAVVCGHIHRYQHMTPRIFYVGSPMPLNFGEAGVHHGVTILDLDPGGSVMAEFVPIESRPFVTYDYDLVDGQDVLADLDALGQMEGAVVKFRYRATADQARRIDHAQIREVLLDAGAHKVYAIEASIERPQRARVAGLDEGIGPLEALRAYVAANEIDTMAAGQMTDRTSSYLAAVGS